MTWLLRLFVPNAGNDIALTPRKDGLRKIDERRFTVVVSTTEEYRRGVETGELLFVWPK